MSVHANTDHNTGHKGSDHKGSDHDRDDDQMSERDALRLADFKQDIEDDADLGDEIRDAANEDMRFINVPGAMWENYFANNPSADTNSGAIPSRARLELDLITDFVQRFKGEWNQNRIMPEFKADDSKTTKDDAELMNGRYRFDFRKGSGKLSTDQAVDEAVTCGYGAMKLATVFEDPEDPENENQDIEWRPKFNAYSSVFWDGAAKRIDKRDAHYCTELEQFTAKSFKRQWPGKKPVSAYVPNDRRFLNSGSHAKGVEADIFIATRYEIVKKKVKVFVYNNLQSGKIEVYSEEDHEKIKDELKADEFREFQRKRTITRQTVEKTVFSGDAILKPTRRIAGKWIPIIPFYGYRQYVDGIETYRGLVRKLKDANLLFNMQVSQLAENAASGGQEVPIFTTDQMLNDSVKASWSNKNNAPYRLISPSYDKDGNLVASGPIGYDKPAMLDQSTTALLEIVPGFLKGITGAQTVDITNREMSGKLFRAMMKRENLNTQVVTDNIANAIVWSGTVYQAMAADIYNTERKLQVIGKDGSESEVHLLEDVVDQETGQTIIANDLTGKKFQSYPDAGPAYDTLAEQTVEDLKGMLDALGDNPTDQRYRPVIMGVLLENITGVGMDPIKDLNRKFMLLDGLIKPATPEEEAMVWMV